MTAQETHPGLLAINLQAKFVATRTQARTLRTKAASMRREAKNGYADLVVGINRKRYTQTTD